MIFLVELIMTYKAMYTDIGLQLVTQAVSEIVVCEMQLELKDDSNTLKININKEM